MKIIEKEVEISNTIQTPITINKNRYYNIDLLKTIAMFMVIMLHTLQWDINFLRNDNVITYLTFLSRILCEGIPIFLVVNGFLIINKKFDIKKHLKKILKIFTIILIWSFIYIISIKCINGENIKLKEIIIEIFSVGLGNKYTGALWFLQNLIMLYLFFPILKSVHDNNKKIYNYFFITVAIFTVGKELIGNIMLIIDGCLKLSLYNYFITFIQKYDFINNGTFIFYFMLGGYLFEYKEIFSKRKNRILAFTIAILSCLTTFMLGVLISKSTNKLVTASFNYSTIFMATIIIGLYAITYQYKNKQHFYNKIIMSIGKNTLGIYLVHIILTAIYHRMIIDNLAIELLFSIIIFIFSYLVVIILKEIPILKKLVSI